MEKEWSDYYKEAAEMHKRSAHNLCKAYATAKEREEKLVEENERLISLIENAACHLAMGDKEAALASVEGV